MNIKEPTVQDMKMAMLRAKDRLAEYHKRGKFRTVAEDVRIRQDYFALKRGLQLFQFLTNRYWDEIEGITEEGPQPGRLAESGPAVAEEETPAQRVLS